MSTGFQHNTPPPPYGKKRQGGRRGATHRKPDGFRSRQVFLRQTSRVGSLPSQLSLREGSHGRRLRPRAPSRAVGGTGPGRRPRRVAHTALRGSEHAGEPASAGARKRTASRHVNGAPYANRLRAPAFGTAMRSAARCGQVRLDGDLAGHLRRAVAGRSDPNRIRRNSSTETASEPPATRRAPSCRQGSSTP